MLNSYPRSVFIFSVCQALMMTGTLLLLSITAVAARSMTGSNMLSTVPFVLLDLGILLIAFAASVVMLKLGRRIGFILGAMLGLIGAIICFIAIDITNFLLLCLGVFVYGGFIATGQYYRFAAAEIVDKSKSGQAVAFVMLGGLFAAAIAPVLSILKIENLSDQSASFIFISGLCVLSAFLQLFITTANPKIENENVINLRKSLLVIRKSVFIYAASGASLAYVVMNIFMITAPLALQDIGNGHTAISIILGLHMIGMFAPSFITGHLISRFKAQIILVTACFILGLSALAAAFAQDLFMFAVSLVLVGVGWNFIYTSGTVMIANSYDLQDEKAAAEGANETITAFFMMLSSVFAGWLYGVLGWAIVSWLVFFMIVVFCYLAVKFDRSITSQKAVLSNS